MLTEDQGKWINYLSDSSKIKIIPFDPSSQTKFEKVKLVIQSKLGENTRVEHHGATSLGISGQDEIDVYIPVLEKSFDDLIAKLTQLFGKPKSHYPLERARFVTTEDEKHVDVFLINEERPNWSNMVRFENYLKTHPETLDRYRRLKEAGTGLAVRDYYRKKLEFINEVLERT